MARNIHLRRIVKCDDTEADVLAEVTLFTIDSEFPFGVEVLHLHNDTVAEDAEEVEAFKANQYERHQMFDRDETLAEKPLQPVDCE